MKSLSHILLAIGMGTAFAGHAADFKLSSPSLSHGSTLPDKHVFNGFGCQGANLSPALQWEAAPAGTRSFAVTAYDPDAPTGSGWWHWVVYNLPANARSLPENASKTQALPTGTIEGRTDFGTTGYGGACPPAGDKPHRYIFTIHALKTPRIDLPTDASAAMVGFMLHLNRLDSASLEVTYHR